MPALRAARSAGLAWSEATVETLLRLLATMPDTLIARKAGAAESARVAARAREVMRAGGLATTKGVAAARRLDADLRRDGNRRNPGTSADLVAAALFVWRLEHPDHSRSSKASGRSDVSGSGRSGHRP